MNMRGGVRGILGVLEPHHLILTNKMYMCPHLFLVVGMVRVYEDWEMGGPSRDWEWGRRGEGWKA